MTVEFPAPAAPREQPGTPAPQPTFPVYEPQPANAGPVLSSVKSGPLGEFHKVEETNPEPEHGELLFTIAGKPLYAPREEDIDPAIGFRMIRDMRRFGPQIAAMNAFGELLGEEALDLLCDAPKMSKEDWARIMEVLGDKVFSNLQDNMPGGKG